MISLVLKWHPTNGSIKYLWVGYGRSAITLTERLKVASKLVALNLRARKMTVVDGATNVSIFKFTECTNYPLAFKSLIIHWGYALECYNIKWNEQV